MGSLFTRSLPELPPEAPLPKIYVQNRSNEEITVSVVYRQPERTVDANHRRYSESAAPVRLKATVRDVAASVDLGAPFEAETKSNQERTYAESMNAGTSVLQPGQNVPFCIKDSMGYLTVHNAHGDCVWLRHPVEQNSVWRYENGRVDNVLDWHLKTKDKLKSGNIYYFMSRDNQTAWYLRHFHPRNNWRRMEFSRQPSGSTFRLRQIRDNRFKIQAQHPELETWRGHPFLSYKRKDIRLYDMKGEASVFEFFLQSSGDYHFKIKLWYKGRFKGWLGKQTEVTRAKRATTNLEGNTRVLPVLVNDQRDAVVFALISEAM